MCSTPQDRSWHNRIVQGWGDIFNSLECGPWHIRTLQARSSTGKKEPGSVPFKQAEKSCHSLLRVISGRGEIRAMWEMLVFLLHGRNKDASLPQVKDLHLMATVLLFLSCKSSVIYSPSVCIVINPDGQRGERLMAQVSLHHLRGKASIGSVCKAWGPAGCAFCSKQYFTVFGGKSRISLGCGIIIIGVCLWDLCCSGNVFL